MLPSDALADYAAAAACLPEAARQTGTISALPRFLACTPVQRLPWARAAPITDPPAPPPAQPTA